MSDDADGTLAEALDQIEDGFFSVDRDWRYTYLNRSAELYLRRPRAELLGRVVWEVLPELVGTEIERQYRAAAAGTAAVEVEIFAPIARRWVAARLLPTASGLSVSFRDVTGHKLAQDALRESEARFRAMFESSLDAMVLGSPEGDVFAANPAACALLGRTEAEYLEAGRAGVVVEDDPRFAAFLAERERTGRARGEVTMRRADGTTFPAELSSALFVDQLGRRRACVSIRDLTERDRTEQARRLLTEAGRVLPVALDAGATLDALARLTVPAFADAAVVDLVEEGRLRRVLAGGRGRAGEVRPLGGPSARGVSRVLATGEPEIGTDVDDAWPREAGAGPDAAPTSLVIVPLAARGVALGALSLLRRGARPPFAHDDLPLARGLADRAALALDNARLYADAVEARRRRDEMLGVVSHDLRNPLNVIGLNARLLRRTAPGEAVDAIRIAAARADRLVNDLVAITAIESGRLPLARSPQPAAPLVEEVAALHRSLGLERAVGIEVAVDGALPLVDVDAHRVVQALSNLVGNALRFAPTGTAVTLRARAEGGAVAVDVIDRGPGIAPEHLAHVCDRFWQGRPDARAGVGLGLAIARGIAEAHGGALRVASTAGEGATFALVLPAA
jgi:PAS domain S-box-containing protein